MYEGSFKVTLLSILLVFIVVGSLCFHFLPGNRDLISFVAALIGGSAAIYAGFYNGLGVKALRQLEKDKASFAIIDKFNDHEMTKVRRILDHLDKENKTEKQVYEYITSDSERMAVTVLYCSIFEDISIAIQYGYANEEILHKSLNYICKYLYEELSGFIRILRTERKSETIYIEFDKLHQAWKDGKSLKTMKPF